MWPMKPSTGPVPLLDGVRQALKDRGDLSDAVSPTLRMLIEPGQIDHRPVRYFRVFDPKTVVQTGQPLRRYDYLPLDLILHAGYLEENGSVVLTTKLLPSLI